MERLKNFYHPILSFTLRNIKEKMMGTAEVCNNFAIFSTIYVLPSVSHGVSFQFIFFYALPLLFLYFHALDSFSSSPPVLKLCRHQLPPVGLGGGGGRRISRAFLTAVSTFDFFTDEGDTQ